MKFGQNGHEVFDVLKSDQHEEGGQNEPSFLGRNKKEILLIKRDIKQKYASIIRAPVLTIFRNAGSPEPYWISFSIKFAATHVAAVLRLFLLKNYSIIKF